MAKLLLNRNSDSADFSVEDDLVLKAYTYNSITTIDYLDGIDGFRKTLSVTETLTNLGNLSKNLVSVTLADRNSIVDSGTTTSATTRKLVQTGQNFSSTVTVNDRVHNTTDDTWAIVTAIDSNTTLSLDEDIMASGDVFNIYSISGSTAWINKERVLGVSEINKQAVLSFDNGGAAKEQIKLSTTQTAWKTSVIEKSNNLSYAIASYTAAPNTILIATAEGDVENKFTAGDVFSTYGEGTVNDSLWSVVSAAWDGTNTIVTVTETPTAATAYNGRIEKKVDGGSNVVSETETTLVVTITKANILAMNGTPVTVVAAAGAGKVLEFVSATLVYDYNTATYGGGGDVTLGYTGGATITSTILKGNSFGATGSMVYPLNKLNAAGGISMPINTPISITNATGAFTDPGGAEGVGRLHIVYKTITTAF